MHILLSAALAQSPATPLRTGDVARTLTEEDVVAVQRVLPDGQKPWLLNGDPGQIPNREYVEAYLPPTTTTVVLRRGLLIVTGRQMTPPGTWSANGSYPYAQVAVAGRSFNEIQGDQDTNRPFRVIGDFNDAELVGLVDFVRSSARVRGRDQGAVIENWPILSVHRDQDGFVHVMLRGAVMRGQAMTLRQAGQDWTIVRVGMWIN